MCLIMLLYLTYQSFFSLFGYGSILCSVLVFIAYVMSLFTLTMWVFKKKVFKVIFIKAQNKHTLGIVKEQPPFIFWVTPLINPFTFMFFFFLSGTVCYCCIEEFGKMETLHLGSEPQPHFCRQSKNKQPHNTYKLPVKTKKKQSGHGHTQY